MEARAGDVSMQVLVAQMYRCGYGVAKNEQKVNPLCCSPGNGSLAFLRQMCGLQKPPDIYQQFGRSATSIQVSAFVFLA
ncbi:hypothetical protein B296_00005612 [Ensete ventricosum]|uniref:Uncharacterized protein n=1 Tax=Ensete ventricosum TaxID=4639 RepID=A0A427A6H8_ENSVE|nr:hypothetical protein B296_00005612 [Ensete ventricosum]